MRNLIVMDSNKIKLILISLIGVFLVPLQSNFASAATGDFTINTDTSAPYSDVTLTYGTPETISVVVELGSATADTLTVSTSFSGVTVVRTNGTYDGIFDVLLPAEIDSGTYTVDFLWENDGGPETSTASVNLVVTAIAPSAPSGLTATAGNGAASISFTAGSTGGSPITDYLYSVDSGAWTSAGASASPISITGLTNGTTYSIELRAVNLVDSGTVSSAITVTPSAPAPAPAPEPVYIPTKAQAALTLSASATNVEWGSQLTLTLTGGSGAGKVTYSSSGTTYCVIDKDGAVTPLSVGICSITATKAGDGTYSSAQSNSITITATDKPVPASTSASTSNSKVSMIVGKPVGGVATVKFTVTDAYAGEKVSVILATKNSVGKTIYKTLGSAKVDSTGAVTYKTKVSLPVGAVLQLKSAGEVIFSKSIK